MYTIDVITATSNNSLYKLVGFTDKEAQSAIEWSEVLDEVFTDNYRTDPALSWQYFGSSSGVLRHYPGKGILPFSSIQLKSLMQLCDGLNAQMLTCSTAEREHGL